MAEIKITIPKLKIPKLACGLLGVSLLLHAGLLCLAGGWVLYIKASEYKIPEAFAERPLTMTDEWDAPSPEPELDDFEPVSASADATAEPSLMMDAGMFSGGSELSSFIAAMPAAVGVIGSVLSDSRAAGGGGSSTISGEGRPAKGLGKITVGNIFNTRVESAKLGVLLDVSSSAHPYLPVTVSEIERSFSDAVIVLAYGCGMYEKAGADTMYVKELSRCKLPADAEKNTLGQIAKAAAADGEVGALFKKFRARPNTYVLYAENCGHTHYGFKKLLDEKVDTVYWFADFRDKISNRPANQLIKELQQRGVKVIAHNFTGNPVPEEGEHIAIATGGSTIAKVPGGKKK